MGNSSSANKNNNNNTTNSNSSNSRDNINNINGGNQRCKSKEEILSIVNKQPPNADEINQLILSLKENFYNGDIDTEYLLSNLEYIFYASDNFEPVTSYFTSLSKPVCCSKVWGAKYLFYRCRTCALSPNSSICFECFKRGPHEKEGHDYSMSFASYGGSCDCGSLDSWKKTGFCSEHQHPEVDKTPSGEMDPLHLLTTHLVLRHVLQIFLELNLNNKKQITIPQKNNNSNNNNGGSSSNNNNNNNNNNKDIIININPIESRESISISILIWIKEIAHICRSISHVLSEELCYQTLDPMSIDPNNIKPLLFTNTQYQQSFIQQYNNSMNDHNVVVNTSGGDGESSLLKFIYQLPIEFQSPLHKMLMISKESIRQEYMFLFLYLLCEHTFKFGFSQSYLKVYQSLCSKDTVDILFKFSPQIFSVCSVSEQFSIGLEHGFLDCIFESLFFHLRTSNVLEKNHIAIVSDLKTILQHKNIAFHMLYEKSKYLEYYIKLCLIIQSTSDDSKDSGDVSGNNATTMYGDYQKRYTDQHIPYEDVQWIQFFQIDTELKEISNILIESLSMDKCTIEGLKKTIEFIADHFVADPQISRDLALYHGVPVSKKDLFKGEKSITTTLPYNRFLGMVIHRCKSILSKEQQTQSITLRDLIPTQFKLGAFLYPLLMANVYTQQVNSNYWVRNGDVNVKKKAYVYSLFFLELDLSLIQMIASVLPINEFIVFTSKEFGSLIPYGSINTDGDLMDNQLMMINNNVSLSSNLHRYSHFLKFIIEVLQERLFFMSPDQHTKYTLIQILCSKPKAHSQIDSVMNYVERELKYEHILKEISDEIQPSADNPTHYKMKNEFWRYFNLYYPIYTPYILGEESLQAFFEYKKFSKIQYPNSLPLPPIIENNFITNNQINSNNNSSSPLELLDTNHHDEIKFLEIINSDYLHFTITNILLSFIQGKETNEIGCGINDAFYLLVFILEIISKKNKQQQTKVMEDEKVESSSSPTTGKIDIPWNLLDKPLSIYTTYSNAILCVLQKFNFFGISRSTLDILLEYYQESCTNNLYIDKKEYIDRSLYLLYDFHPDIAKRINTRSPLFASSKIVTSNSTGTDGNNKKDGGKDDGDDDDKDNNENKLKDAKKRQAEIMAKFAKQQTQFLQNIDHFSEFDDEDDDLHAQSSNNGGKKKNTPMSSPSGKHTTTTTTTTTTNSFGMPTSPFTNGVNSNPISTSRELFNENIKNQSCVLCYESHMSDLDPLSLISFVQPSKMIAYSKFTHVTKEYPELTKYDSYSNGDPMFYDFPQKRELNTLNYMSSLHIRSCGHYIHKKCHSNYFSKILNQEQDEITFKPTQKEYLCPLCRRVGNIIIPTYTESSVSCSPIISSFDISNYNNNNINSSSGGSFINSSSSSVNNSISSSGNNSISGNGIINNSISSSGNGIVNNSGSSISNSNSPNLFGVANSLSIWVDGLKKRLKDLIVIEPKGKLFFTENLNDLISNSIYDGASPLVYYQIVSKNIEFLELSSRVVDGVGGKKSFPISNELFGRDMLTIHTLFNLIGVLNQSSLESKFKERLVDIIRGKNGSILSIDPFSIFIVLVSILGTPTSQDIEFITTLVLNLFITQFCLTNLYLEKDINKKQVKSISQLFQATYINSNNNNNNVIKQKYQNRLEMSLEPLVRCLYIANQFLQSQPPTSLNSNGGNYIVREDLTNKEKIFSKLGIQSMDQLITRALSNNPYLTAWLSQMESKKLDPFFVFDYRRPKFIALPDSFEDFFVANSNKKCNNSAVCLLCSQSVCTFKCECVKDERANSISEGFKHTLKCGSFKIGFFLESKSPKIHILRDFRKSTFNSSYLDQYGETDVLLDRGKPLMRCDNNIQELWNCWITHSIEDRYLSSSLLNSRTF